MLSCLIAFAVAKPLPTDSFLKVWTFSDFQVSTDGRRLAYVASEPMTEKAHQNIWLADAKGGDAKQFTTSSGVDRSPRFSPDGKSLYFISNRSGDNQIYRIALDGGEAVAVLPSVKKVEGFELSPDGKQLAYTAPAKERPKDEPDPQIVESADIPTGLFVADTESPKPKLITKPAETVMDFSWAEGGKRLFVGRTEAPTGLGFPDRFEFLDPASGTTEEVKDVPAMAGFAAVSPTGSVAWIAPRSGDGPVAHDLFIRRGPGASVEDASLKEDHLIMPTGFRNDGSAYGRYIEGLDTGIFEMTPDGTMSYAKEPGTCSAVGSSIRGRYLYAMVTPSKLPEVYYREGTGAPRQISHLNEGTLAHSLATSMRFTYPSFDGKQIEAILTMPASTTPGKLPALVVNPHGGPTGQNYWGYNSWAQFLTAHGYAVLQPNFRGSTGYGWDFMVSNKGDWGGGDYKDVMAGVDAVVAKGLVDPKRLAIAGWSYGGYMAAWAVTQTDRFKASVIGAPMTDLPSEYGSEGLDTHRYDAWFHGQLWDDLSGTLKQSPITYVKNVHTPCLLLQGSEDNIDPPGQSLEFYRALKHYGVEAQMALYPGEPHGFVRPKHRIDVLDRMLAFLDTHVK